MLNGFHVELFLENVQVIVCLEDLDRGTSVKDSGVKYSIFDTAEMIKTPLSFYVFLLQSLVKTQPGGGGLSPSCFSACFPRQSSENGLFSPEM